MFEEEFKTTFESRVPLYEDELREIFNESKNLALDHFNKKALGEVSEDYIEDLQMKFDQRYSQYKAENENESWKSCQIFLQNQYQMIEDKLRNQEYQSFNEFTSDISSFQEMFVENGPPGPNRKTIMLEFVVWAVADASEYFLRSITHELKLSSKMNKETVIKLEANI